MELSGKGLSMDSEAVYKGEATHNGTLLKVLGGSYTIGYSELLNSEATGEASVEFGNGVFIDAQSRENRIYAGEPSYLGAVPAFYGIIVREPALASTYPVNNNKVQGFQHGEVCKWGFLIYKKGAVCSEIGSIEEDLQLADHVYANFVMWVRKSTGEVYFTASSDVYYQSGDIKVGRVTGFNPDDDSITVYISPEIISETSSSDSYKPEVATISNTTDSITAKVEGTLPGEVTVKYKVKTNSDDTYITVGVFKLTANESETGYESESFTVSGLATGTIYTFKAEMDSAAGYQYNTVSISTASA